MNCSHIWLKVNFSWFLLSDYLLPCCLLSPAGILPTGSSSWITTIVPQGSSVPRSHRKGLAVAVLWGGRRLLCSPGSLRTVSTFERRHLQQTWRLTSSVQEDFSSLLTTASVTWPGLGRAGELGLFVYWKRDMSRSRIHFPGFSCSLHGWVHTCTPAPPGPTFPQDAGRCWRVRNSSFSYPALETVTQPGAWECLLPESFPPLPWPRRRSVDPT